MRRILILQGHPDPERSRFEHAPTERYRHVGALGIKVLGRHILAFVGIGPIHRNPVGLVEGMQAAQRARWLQPLRRLGERGE